MLKYNINFTGVGTSIALTQLRQVKICYVPETRIKYKLSDFEWPEDIQIMWSQYWEICRKAISSNVSGHGRDECVR
jgi:hypothetical protein